MTGAKIVSQHDLRVMHYEFERVRRELDIQPGTRDTLERFKLTAAQIANRAGFVADHAKRIERVYNPSHLGSLAALHNHVMDLLDYQHLAEHVASNGFALAGSLATHNRQLSTQFKVQSKNAMTTAHVISREISRLLDESGREELQRDIAVDIAAALAHQKEADRDAAEKAREAEYTRKMEEYRAANEESLKRQLESWERLEAVRWVLDRTRDRGPDRGYSR